MTRLLPSAEHVLELGIRRAISLIQSDRYADALRALLVAGQAAELIQTEAETLVNAQLGQGGAVVSRITDTLVVQRVDDTIVVMDESTGAEVVFPVEALGNVLMALTYLGGADVLEATP